MGVGGGGRRFDEAKRTFLKELVRSGARTLDLLIVIVAFFLCAMWAGVRTLNIDKFKIRPAC